MYVKIVSGRSLGQQVYLLTCESPKIRTSYFERDDDLEGWEEIREDLNTQAGFEKYKPAFFPFGRPEIISAGTKVVFVETDDQEIVVTNAEVFILGNDGSTIDKL